MYPAPKVHLDPRANYQKHSQGPQGFLQPISVFPLVFFSNPPAPRELDRPWNANRSRQTSSAARCGDAVPDEQHDDGAQRRGDEARALVGRVPAVHEVPLTPLAIELLRSLPWFAGSDWIFTVDGRYPISSFTRLKKKLDKTSGVTGWTLHDLRRTGRTLMADLEVLDETAERVLGHSQGGLMATYNVSRHRKQKTAALLALEADLLRIVNKPEGNVVPLRFAS